MSTIYAAPLNATNTIPAEYELGEIQNTGWQDWADYEAEAVAEAEAVEETLTIHNRPSGCRVFRDEFGMHAAWMVE